VHPKRNCKFDIERKGLYMDVFYVPTTGAMAEIPSGCNGGKSIVALIESGAALSIKCDENFRGHVDAKHCYLLPGNKVAMKAESEWPENQPAGG
jgi:hypothetical protein